MKILIALAAAGLFATTASAQSTVSTTRKTTVIHKTMVEPVRHNAHRVCHTHWRHHKKIRTCRTTRW